MGLQTSLQRQRHRSPRTTVEPDVAPPGYETLSLAGRGAFSEVWKIRDLKTGQPFALKRLQAEWQHEPTANQLLSNEAEVGQAVCSPYVVRVEDFDADAAPPFTVLEWIDGTNLDRKLADTGRMPAGLAVWIARQCAQGLADLQRAGFSHGDVKPANMLVTPHGLVKLIDLGFARLIAQPHDCRPDNVMMGTAEYMAPETLSRERCNPVTRDLYSLGVTLFRLLTGRLPFLGETPADVLKQQRQSRPPQLRRWCPEAPRELAELVNRLLAKQPIRRPQSFRMLVAELIDLELATLTERSEL